MRLSSDVTNALIAGGFSVAGTLITVAVAWARDLNASALRTRTLDEATKRATFWDAWLKTQLAVADDEQHIASIKSKVHDELAALASVVEAAFRDSALHVQTVTVQSAAFHQLRNSISWFRRWLLLYRPARPLAWIPRLFFYFFVADTLALPIIWADPSQRQDWQYGLAGFLFLILVFRGLSVWIEKPHIASQHAQ